MLDNNAKDEIAAQLARLQDALLEGRIDQETYEKLKADLLAVQPVSNEAAQPAVTAELVDEGETQQKQPREQESREPTKDLPKATEWYCVQNGQRYGPATELQVRDWLKAGNLLPEDLVWHEGMAEWIKVSDCEELLSENLALPPDLPSGIQTSPQSESHSLASDLGWDFRNEPVSSTFRVAGQSALAAVFWPFTVLFGIGKGAELADKGIKRVLQREKRSEKKDEG